MLFFANTAPYNKSDSEVPIGTDRSMTFVAVRLRPVPEAYSLVKGCKNTYVEDLL